MVGIVILNYMTYNRTIECVNSIVNSTFCKFQIYIVDNASPNESYEILYQKFNRCKNIHVLRTKVNLGFAGGNNLGIDKAMNDGINYILLTNNDILFEKNSIDVLYEFSKANKDSVIVGPRILSPQGNVQYSSSLEKTSFCEVLGLNFLFKKRSHKVLNEEELMHPEKVYTVSGCCFMIIADKFKKMGAFDENTFLYNEENILGCQAEKNKYHIYFFPSSEVVHFHGATTGRQNLFVAQELLKSSLYYWRSYRIKKKRDLLYIFIVHTTKGLLKSIYNKGYRKGWNSYFSNAISALKKEVRLYNVSRR